MDDFFKLLAAHFGLPAGLERIVDKKLCELHLYTHKKRMARVLRQIPLGKHRLVSRNDHISWAIYRIMKMGCIGNVFCWQNWLVERAHALLTYRQFKHYVAHGYVLVIEFKKRRSFGQ
jgi:hypothetical protein